MSRKKNDAPMTPAEEKAAYAGLVAKKLMVPVTLDDGSTGYIMTPLGFKVARQRQANKKLN